MKEGKERSDSAGGEGGKGRPGKRAYEPPEIVSMEPLESIAGFCTKVLPGLCNFPPPVVMRS